MPFFAQYKLFCGKQNRIVVLIGVTLKCLKTVLIKSIIIEGRSSKVECYLEKNTYTNLHFNLWN